MVPVAAVHEAIATVHDPCSLRSGLPLSFPELGMVDAVSVDDDRVLITLRLDDPTCAAFRQIVEGLERAVRSVDGVEHVEVTMRGDASWSEDDMTPAARAKLAARREALRAEVIREQVWRAIGEVHEPCSLTNGTNLPMTELGMIDAVDAEGGQVKVTLLLDCPNCIFMKHIVDRIEQTAGTVVGVDEVAVELRTDEFWTPERMTPTGRAKLERYRARQRERYAHLPLVTTPKGDVPPALAPVGSAEGSPPAAD